MKKYFRILLVSSLIAVSILAGAQSSPIVVPAGTVLPVQLSSTINSGKAHPGQKVTAEIMQDVPLPAGAHIPRGAKVIGQVVAVRPANPNSKGELLLRFDTLVIRKQEIPVTTHLRAMASMMAVSRAQVPESGPDRGTSSYIWTTELIGGQVNYHGGGLITQGNQVVGHSTANGVLVRPTASAGASCEAGSAQLQAFWVFSSFACGIYDFGDLRLVHAGRTQPPGEITLQSANGNVNLHSGTGMLLSVE